MKTIVEENSYATDLNKLMEQYAHVPNVHEGITWALARRPDAGEPIQAQSSYRVFNTVPMGQTPSFTVLYLYDETADPDCVYLYGIRAQTDD